MDLDALADQLHEAQRTRTPCAPLTQAHPELSVTQSYAIQQINVDRAQRALIGRKIGLTSHAIQSWLGVDQPDFGALLDDMLVPEGQGIDISTLLQPRAEAEIAFVLDRDLGGEVISSTDVIAATDFVLPALEIIDSRIADWKITYCDTIADNASSARFVLGQTPTKLTEIDDLALSGMALRKNGRVVSTGAGAACMDHPINAVVWLANTLRDLGTPLQAGDIVLSGALGPVTPVASGDRVSAHIAGLGHVHTYFHED